MGKMDLLSYYTAIHHTFHPQSSWDQYRALAKLRHLNNRRGARGVGFRKNHYGQNFGQNGQNFDQNGQNFSPNGSFNSNDSQCWAENSLDYSNNDSTDSYTDLAFLMMNDGLDTTRTTTTNNKNQHNNHLSATTINPNLDPRRFATPHPYCTSIPTSTDPLKSTLYVLSSQYQGWEGLEDDYSIHKSSSFLQSNRIYTPHLSPHDQQHYQNYMDSVAWMGGDDGMGDGNYFDNNNTHRRDLPIVMFRTNTSPN